MTDALLITRFATSQDQEAFRLLVERHIDLVYAAARRQVIDPTRAQDVTQAVFILLSRNAPRLQRHRNIAGWLVRTTHFVCRDAKKCEQRRRYHETRAGIMNENQPVHSQDDSWDAIRPFLDEAVAGLHAAARTAVALRFLENKSLREVGEALGISEEAARKRVDRAIDQLRRILTAKGVIVPAALGAVLVSKAAEAAPPAAHIAATASATPAIGTLAAGGARLLLWGQMKFALTAAAALLIVFTAAAIPLLHGNTPATIATTAPATSATLASATAPDTLFRGTLLDPTGQPVANATVRAYISNELVNDRLESQTQTAADGTFTIGPLPPPKESAHRVFLFDAPGFALAWKWEQSIAWFDDPEALRITLERATEVTGTLMNAKGQPIPNATIEALASPKPYGYGNYFYFTRDNGLAVTSDAQGRYRLPRISESTRLQLTVRHPDYQTWSTQFRPGDVSPIFPVAAGTTDADIQLEDHPATLRVQLTHDGKPVARAGVTLQAINRPRGQNIQTDADGIARFTGLAPGTWSVESPGVEGYFDMLIVPVADIALRADESRDIAVEIGTHPVRVTLLDGDSTLPVRQRISIDALNPKRNVAFTMRKENGPFKLFLPPGTYQLSTTPREYEKNTPVSQDFAITPDAAPLDITLRLHATPDLRGRLIDSAGNPLPGVVILDYQRHALAGVDGHFSLPASSLEPMGQITGVAMDSRRKMARIFFPLPPAAGDSELQLVLEPMGEITGKVVGPAGRPVPETVIDLCIQDPSGRLSSRSENWLWHTTLKEDGTFRITNVPADQQFDIYLHDLHESAQFATTRVKLNPGQTRDLGEIVLHGVIGSTQATIAAGRNPDAVLTLSPREKWDISITGRILDLDSKPVVGVRIGANMASLSQPLPMSNGGEGVTDLKGRFTISGLPHTPTLRLGASDNGTLYLWNITPTTTPIELRLTPEAKAAGTQP